jgi:hypothetical protein
MERNEVLVEESGAEYNRDGAMVMITGGSDEEEEEVP